MKHTSLFFERIGWMRVSFFGYAPSDGFLPGCFEMIFYSHSIGIKPHRFRAGLSCLIGCQPAPGQARLARSYCEIREETDCFAAELRRVMPRKPGPGPGGIAKSDTPLEPDADGALRMRVPYPPKAGGKRIIASLM